MQAAPLASQPDKTIPPGPVSQLEHASPLATEPRTNPRTNGENLAQEEKTEKPSIKKEESALTTGLNFAKKLGSRVLNVIGGLGSAASIGVYFLIGSKLFSVLLGIPSLMCFYIASTFKQNSDSSEFIQPKDRLEKAIQDPQYFDNNLDEIINALKRLRKIPPRLLKDLEAIIEEKLGLEGEEVDQAYQEKIKLIQKILDDLPKEE